MSPMAAISRFLATFGYKRKHRRGLNQMLEARREVLYSRVKLPVRWSVKGQEFTPPV